ncbi:hypothetical protein F4818DRAFT_331626 [Hypoxylon cercidicola]|nr:hypothetical protein F4818DRAFT_331626 [Hypoxylon cercidicola]
MSTRVTFRCAHTELVAGNDPNAIMPDLSYPLTPDTWAGQAHLDHVSSSNFCGWECFNNCPTSELGFELAADDKKTAAATTTTTTTTDNEKKKKKPDGGETVGSYKPGWGVYSGYISSSGSDADADDETLFQQASVKSPPMPANLLDSVGTGKGTGAKGRMGMPDAVYGVPRIGVGWRSDVSWRDEPAADKQREEAGSAYPADRMQADLRPDMGSISEYKVVTLGTMDWSDGEVFD